jgi:hypothetical protein
MVLSYPKVSKIGVKRYCIADVFPNGIFIYLLYINDFLTVPLDYYLGLQGVALFPPNNTLFDLLSGGL